MIRHPHPPFFRASRHSAASTANGGSGRSDTKRQPPLITWQPSGITDTHTHNYANTYVHKCDCVLIYMCTHTPAMTLIQFHFIHRNYLENRDVLFKHGRRTTGIYSSPFQNPLK